ncbi:hypothetical protein ACLMJK_001797 [Lecanora helva]
MANEKDTNAPNATEEDANTSNGDNGVEIPVEHTEDAAKNPSSEVQSENNVDEENTKSSPKRPANEDEGAEKGPTGDGRPSKRVREGQRWNDRNDRPPRYNKYDRSDKKRNIKSDFTSQKESSDPIAIRKQVEFYFSDSNLLQDKFLFTKVEGHENVPIPISLIHSFKRMRHFQPLSAVIDALKESTTLDVVEDDTAIKRKEPLPEGLVGKPMVEIQKVHEDASMARSIYAKGFGDEEPSTQFDIEAFFANFGTTNSVRLRRAYDRTFKGSVFVEFDSEPTQKSFLALDPKPKWQNRELQIKSKKQYCDDKVEDIKAGKVRPNSQEDRDGYHHKTIYNKRRDSPDYEKGKRHGENDDRDWRVRRDEDRKSGFKNRGGGKHRGFGSSKRGRGGRDNRGRRDSSDERDRKDERGVPKVKTTSSDSDNEGGVSLAPPTATPANDEESSKPDDAVAGASENGVKLPPTTTENDDDKTTSDSSSKKRAREEDDVPEGEGSTKKLDTKGEES